jgi:group I intron endonuclease
MYVGQHNEPDVSKRWKEHWGDAERGCKYTLHNSMRKYGRDAFTIEVLCVVPNGDAICRMEEYYAEQFETYVWDNPGGYNMIWCGKRGRAGIKSSPETREKQSSSMKVFHSINPISQETREKMSASRKGVESPRKGVPCSE